MEAYILRPQLCWDLTRDATQLCQNHGEELQTLNRSRLIKVTTSRIVDLRINKKNLEKEIKRPCLIFDPVHSNLGHPGTFKLP